MANDNKKEKTSKPDGEKKSDDEDVDPFADVELDKIGSGSGEIKLDGGDLVDLGEEFSPDGGLLDLDLPSDESKILKSIEDEFTDVAPAKKSLEYKINHHDKEMEAIGFVRKGNSYFGNKKTILFVNDTKSGESRAYVLFGYSLENIVPAEHTIQDIQFVADGKKTMRLYSILDRFAKNYLGVDGRIAEGVVRDAKHSRVAFACSVPYNSSSTTLKDELGGIDQKAGEYSNKIKKAIEKRVGGGKQIEYLEEVVAFKLYRWAWDRYKKRRSISQPAEEQVSSVDPAVAAAIEEYKEQQDSKTIKPTTSAKRPGYIPSIKQSISNWLRNHS